MAFLRFRINNALLNSRRRLTICCRGLWHLFKRHLLKTHENRKVENHSRGPNTNTSATKCIKLCKLYKNIFQNRSVTNSSRKKVIVCQLRYPVNHIILLQIKVDRHNAIQGNWNTPEELKCLFYTTAPL